MASNLWRGLQPVEEVAMELVELLDAFLLGPVAGTVDDGGQVNFPEPGRVPEVALAYFGFLRGDGVLHGGRSRVGYRCVAVLPQSRR